MRKKEKFILTIKSFEYVELQGQRYEFGTHSDKLTIPEEKWCEYGAHIKGGFLEFRDHVFCSLENQKVKDEDWLYVIDGHEISGGKDAKLEKMKELFSYEQIGKELFFPQIGIESYLGSIEVCSKEEYNRIRNYVKYVFGASGEVTFHNRTFHLGDTWDTLKDCNSFSDILYDYATKRRTTRSTHFPRLTFTDEKLVLIHSMEGSCSEIEIAGHCETLATLVPALKKEVESQVICEYPPDHWYSTPGELVFFPTLGLLADNRSDLYFGTKEELIRVVREKQMEKKEYHLLPFEGYQNGAGNMIRFGETCDAVDGVDGVPQKVKYDMKIMKKTTEWRDEGIELDFSHNVDGIDNYTMAPLVDVTFFFDKCGSKLFVDGIDVFADKLLEEMKNTYEYEDGTNGLRTIFPTLGLLVVGCGKRKNNRGHGAEGRYAIIFSHEKQRFYERYLNI